MAGKQVAHWQRISWRMSWRKLMRGLGLLLAGAGLVACRPVSPPPTPEPPDSVPAEIRYSAPTAPEDFVRILPDDDAFSSLAGQLGDLVTSIQAQARTFFDPARFDDEVATTEHLYARYAEEIELVGPDIRRPVLELVVVVVGDDPMLLVRSGDEENWSVYVPDRPEKISEILANAARALDSPE